LIAIVTNTVEAVDLGVIDVVSTVISVPDPVLVATNGLPPAVES
jgi:hypothetical protein